MEDVKYVGETYAEHLRKVRAIQFGRQQEELTSITEGTKVSKPKGKAPKKEVKKDE